MDTLYNKYFPHILLSVEAHFNTNACFKHCNNVLVPPLDLSWFLKNVPAFETDTERHKNFAGWAVRGAVQLNVFGTHIHKKDHFS